jgi:hypothetical protein
MPKNYSSALDKIRIENRDYVISHLKTGDLVKIKSEILPIIYHYGIIDLTPEGIFILHNHPDKFNSKGGNVIKERFDKWIKAKDIVSVEKTNLNTHDIDELQKALKEYKYDFINFNCEHFVNFAKNKSYASPQVIRWTSIVAISLLVYYLIRNKKI